MDSGAVWEEANDLDFSDLRLSVGVGLRVNLPIGAAIRLDLGYPLIEEETTRHARFSLWIQSIVLDACAENV